MHHRVLPKLGQFYLRMRVELRLNTS